MEELYGLNKFREDEEEAILSLLFLKHQTGSVQKLVNKLAVKPESIDPEDCEVLLAVSSLGRVHAIETSTHISEICGVRSEKHRVGFCKVPKTLLSRLHPRIAQRIAYSESEKASSSCSVESEPGHVLALALA